MPTEHRLWPHKQRGPRGRREPVPQRGDDHSIGRGPPNSLDLPLENLNLTTEHQNLRLKLRPIPLLSRDRVQQDAKERIEQKSQHADAES
jgi:hypothetical protein